MRARLHAAIDPYRRAFPEVRWLDPATWHVTLVFLGSTPSALAGDVAAACDRVGHEAAPFDLDLVAGGGHIRRGDGVAWLTAGGGAGRVLDIAGALARTLEHDIRGLPDPRRASSAHLTVARRADQRLTVALRDEALGGLRAGWPVDRLVLMRSHLGRAGATYEVLHEAPLQGQRED